MHASTTVWAIAALAPSAAAGLVPVAGTAAVIAPPASVEFGDRESDEFVFAFAESSGVTLPRQVFVNITEPGEHIPAGTRVDSYLIHFDPADTSGAVVSATASFEFSEPILGVVVFGSRLVESDDVLGHPSVAYPASEVNRGLEANGTPDFPLDPDTVEVSADRLSLSLSLIAIAPGDQVRVITQSRCGVADIAAPVGLLDLSDVTAFVDGFTGGCD